MLILICSLPSTYMYDNFLFKVSEEVCMYIKFCWLSRYHWTETWFCCFRLMWLPRLFAVVWGFVPFYLRDSATALLYLGLPCPFTLPVGDSQYHTGGLEVTCSTSNKLGVSSPMWWCHLKVIPSYQEGNTSVYRQNSMVNLTSNQRVSPKNQNITSHLSNMMTSLRIYVIMSWGQHFWGYLLGTRELPCFLPITRWNNPLCF